MKTAPMTIKTRNYASLNISLYTYLHTHTETYSYKHTHIPAYLHSWFLPLTHTPSEPRSHISLRHTGKIAFLLPLLVILALLPTMTMAVFVSVITGQQQPHNILGHFIESGLLPLQLHHLCGAVLSEPFVTVLVLILILYLRFSLEYVSDKTSYIDILYGQNVKKCMQGLINTIVR